MRKLTSPPPPLFAALHSTFFKLADANKLSRTKREEKIQPLFDKYAVNQDDWRISKLRRATRSSQTF